MFSGLNIWLLTKQLECSSLGKAISLPISMSCLQFSIWCWSLMSFSHSTRMSIDVILFQVMVRQLCWWDFLGVAFDISRRHVSTANFLFLCLLQSSYPIFRSDSWASGTGTALSVYWAQKRWNHHLCFIGESIQDYRVANVQGPIAEMREMGRHLTIRVTLSG